MRMARDGCIAGRLDLQRGRARDIGGCLDLALARAGEVWGRDKARISR